MLKNMRFRQVHLDFHTSPAIPSVGERFFREQFAEALKRGHVDSITLFSKCHHGYSYHPTTVNEIHPGLKFDLLGAELEVCRELGVNAPVYISAGLDEKEAVRHPEWCAVDARKRYPDFANDAYYHLLCYNTKYLDLLLAQVEEVMRKYDPVGVFLDISAPRDCICASCVASMKRLGLDPNRREDVLRHGEMVYAHYTDEVERVVRKYSRDAAIFHNAGNIDRGRRDIAYRDTHLELESLPTGGWGYDHFPMSASYVRTLGMEYLGMTGKFHTTWGEFGGFKHPNALIYETGLSIAFGAKCSIGDQLHPSGEMNLHTYDLIGRAYAEVEKKEPWCVGAENISDVAVLSREAVELSNNRNCRSDIGCCRMLLEGKYLFDVIDLETPFEGYKLLILPDAVRVDEKLKERLEKYLAGGGKVLATGTSGLTADGSGFALDFGADHAGANAFKPSYMVPAEGVAMINGSTSYVMYSEGQNIEPHTDAEVFAYLAEPYFNRTAEHFCSHQHTPDVPGSRRPAAVLHGSTAYIGWEIFDDYATKGSLCLKELFFHAMKALLDNEKTVTVSGLPDRGIVALTKQTAENRMILHTLFAYTTLRGNNACEVIEDAIPLCNIAVRVKTEKMPRSVRMVPDGETLDFTYEDGAVCFTVPKLLLHAMTEILF